MVTCMKTFKWRDEYKIGDKTIDSQHQELFQLANRMIAAQEIKQLTELAMGLYQYIREHFQLEESLMKQANYPGYAIHVAAHEDLLKKLVALSSKIYDGSYTKKDISDFMKDWVLSHILEQDVAMGKFLHRSKNP